MLGSPTIGSRGATWSARSPVATTSAVYSRPMMAAGAAGCPGGTAKMWTSVPQIPAARTASRTSSGALSSGGSTSRTTSRPSPSNTAACIQPLRKSTQSSQSTQSNCFIHLQAPVETGETVKTGGTVLWLGTDHDLAVFALCGLLDRLHAVGQTETAGDDGGEVDAAGGDEFDDVGKVTVAGVPLRAKELGGARQGDGREANGAGAEDGHMPPGPEPSRAGEHRVVRHAGGLAERAGLIRPLHAAVAIRQGIDLPAVLGIDGDQVGLRAVDGETDLLQPLGLVGVPIAAGRAFSAPDHLLAGDHVAAPQLPDFLSRIHDLAREFVTDHDRKAREAGIEHVPFLVGFVEVHI